MVMYVLSNGVVLETISLANLTNYELGELLNEVVDKNGKDVVIVVSTQNVTDPVVELLGEQTSMVKN